MKRIIIAASLFLTAGALWAGSLTITAPAASSVGGSSPQWQYNQSGTTAGVAPVSINVAAITLSSTHTIVLASATANTGSTYTLPAASNTGQILQITKVDASTQPITILAAGTDLIAGSTRTLTLNAIGQTDEITAGPGGWWAHGQGIQVTPNFIVNGPEGPNSVTQTSSATTVCPVNIPVPVAVTAFRYVSSNPNGGNVSFVLYDRYGTIVASTGPFAIGGFGVNTSTITPVNVPPGIYYLGEINNFNTSSFYSIYMNTTGSGCSTNQGTSMTLPTPFVFGTPASFPPPLIHLIVAGGRTP